MCRLDQNTEHKGSSENELVAHVLETCALLRETPLTNSDVALFVADDMPEISVSDYVRRIVQYGECSPACFVVALVYIGRVVQSHPSTYTASTAHRLIVTAVMLAAKARDDAFFSNEFWSQIGGLPVQQLNALERAFLRLLSFELFVDSKTFEDMQRKLRPPAGALVFGKCLELHQADGTSETVQC
eukprot:NODE_3047_length_950_cov_62.871203_g3027_i0.p1 GENE.NODE_3047_length_950_cov_62.871203_g3027_i0~~NODE_3047_length_950_cov_62.871203_g3027_i0.p1  ORF type:complete len:186 (+),score=18.82 NODE_3047_length_950_cov_62.871203_g3027_i0:110-667(+)